MGKRDQQASVRTSATQNYILSEGRIVPMGEEFPFRRLLDGDAERTATLPDGSKWTLPPFPIPSWIGDAVLRPVCTRCIPCTSECPEP